MTTRRQLLTRVGIMAGSVAMYQAMTRMGHATGTDFKEPPKLSGAAPGTTVLVLGAGLAGMLAAYELRQAGYSVRVLEFQTRSGGRNYTLRGGDTLTELGGATQKIGFAPGNYINPGPWRIPYHHQAILHYCKAFGVALEPFIELNHNAYLHDTNSFGGAPQRYRHVSSDFYGYTAELLSKAINQKCLDQAVTADEAADILHNMKVWGPARPQRRLHPASGQRTPRLRKTPLGRAGRRRRAVPAAAARRDHALRPVAICGLPHAERLPDHHVPARRRHGHDRPRLRQADRRPGHPQPPRQRHRAGRHRRAVTYEDHSQGGAVQTAKAEYCVCTIPLPVLNQLDVARQRADARRHRRRALRVLGEGGLEFKRRFWEEDEADLRRHQASPTSRSA